MLQRTDSPNTFDKTTLVIWAKALVSYVYFKLLSLNIFFETQCYLQMFNKSSSTLIVIKVLEDFIFIVLHGNLNQIKAAVVTLFLLFFF